jgi:single-strand DNA-binding protein
MPFEVEGVMHHVFDTEQKSDKFQAREFVIEIPDGNYPQLIKFQVVQDKVNAVDGISKGEKVKVSFDLRGREWQGKYFTSLNCWRIDKLEQSVTATAGTSMPPPAVSNPFPTAADEPPELDSLPF